jgi:hypothetical protein
MKLRDLFARSRAFKAEGFKAKGSGRYLTLTKALDPERALIVEADLHRKFGEFRLSFRVGVRFHVAEEEFYKITLGEYCVIEDSSSFTLWSSMRNIPERTLGPDLWTFQDNEAEISRVIPEVDHFFLTAAFPWQSGLSDPRSAIEWMVPHQFLHRVERWTESIKCYFLAKHYRLPVPKEALTCIFSCARSDDIGSSVCKRLIERENLI